MGNLYLGCRALLVSIATKSSTCNDGGLDVLGKRLRNTSGRCIVPSLLNTLWRTGAGVETAN